MGDLVDGDDGLAAEAVGAWAKQKHGYLCGYVEITSHTRKKYLGPGKGGATFIDLYCGPGRARVKETGEWIDGGVVAAWKASERSGAPFSRIYIADLDPLRRSAALARLKRLNAPVIAMRGSAAEAVHEVLGSLGGYELNLAFLDPFNLKALDFSILKALSGLSRIDIMVHVNQMDLQRNVIRNALADSSAFDIFAPGWRDHVDTGGAQDQIQRQVFEYWRNQVAALKIGPSTDMRLITGERNQPLYWLLLAAKHELAHKFWKIASNPERQGSLF